MENVRLLGESDRDDILEIARHIWDGHDYLPYSFESWIRDENSHTVGIEQDGHIIALANLRVIEGGKTGWMEGLRVHPDYRGRGLAKVLTNHVVLKAIELELKRIRYTTATDNLESLHLGESVGMSRKFTLGIYWHEGAMEITWRHTTEDIISINADDLLAPLIESNLVPCNVIVYNWKAMDVTSEALQMLAEKSHFWVTRRSDGIAAFSVGFASKGSDGKEWIFTIYARDDSLFLNHLSHHIMLASENTCATFFGAFQEDYSRTLIELDWVPSDYKGDWAQTLLERVLRE